MEEQIGLSERHKKIIEDEKNKEEYKKIIPLQNFLESCNLKVWREVIPDECFGWEHPYRVDMIFEIQNYGLIGVEGKNLNTNGQGGKYAGAYLQIRDKYKNKHYFNGKKVRRWCILGCISSDMGGERVEVFLKHFFNHLGISFLEYERYGWKTSVVIDPLTKHRIDIERGHITGIEKNDFLDYGDNVK